MQTDKRHHYVYRILAQDPATAEVRYYYIGKRTCACEPYKDPYMGSGVRLKHTMKKHPELLWKKQICMFASTEEDAYLYEKAILGDAYQTDPKCLNLIEGGTGGDPAYIREIWRDPQFRAEQEKTRTVSMRINGFTVSVEASEVPSLLRQGYEFCAETIWVHSDVLQARMIVKPPRARQLILAPHSWQYGKRSYYPRITLKQIDPLTGSWRHPRPHSS